MAEKQYRLLTRSDFDGLVCAVLLKHLDMVKEIQFVHPKDMQDRKIRVSANDISTNVPYVPGVHLAFDHHSSEVIRDKGDEHRILDADSPSAARMVWKHFGGHDAFPAEWDDMMEAVDRADSAQFTILQVLKPKRWDLLSFLMDARTGLGRFKDFKISNYNLMMNLIDLCREHTIDEILEMPDVKERVELYTEQEVLFKKQVTRCSTVHKNLVVLNLKDEEVVHAGNRFMIYGLFPECNISMHVMWGKQKLNTVFAVGKSIFKRTSNTNVGELMLKYGGGGHVAAGTCQVPHNKADETMAELIEQITRDG